MRRSIRPTRATLAISTSRTQRVGATGRLLNLLGRPGPCGVFGSGTECHSGQPMLSEPLETQLKANEKDGGVDEEMTDPRAVQGACMVIEPRPPSSPDRHE